MSTSDLVTLIANLALTLSFLIALVFGIEQVKAAKRDRKERLTLDALRNFQSREFAQLINFVTRNKMPASRDEMNATPNETQVLYIQFAQEMESLGILVAEKIVDLDLVDKTLGSLVSTSWEKYKPLFTDLRVKQPDPFLGEYFQWLAERVEERLRKNPRKPFHKVGRTENI